MSIYFKLKLHFKIPTLCHTDVLTTSGWKDISKNLFNLGKVKGHLQRKTSQTSKPFHYFNEIF